ncbi:ATP-binding protein [Actinocorallia longicatena]|uniref:ATP-binding protein n=1 Tax=Actinocorallia longicatena TaxID=111803 RepID=UPI003CD08A48
MTAAQFPRDKSLRAFDFDANPGIDPATIHTLATCEWVKKGQPLCLIGDSGTGKSHLPSALGTEAAMKGLQSPLHPGRQAGERTRRGRRRESAGPDPDDRHPGHEQRQHRGCRRGVPSEAAFSLVVSTEESRG